MTSQVHDELLFEIHKKEKDIIPEITNLMETSHQKYKSFKIIKFFKKIFW